MRFSPELRLEFVVVVLVRTLTVSINCDFRLIVFVSFILA